LEGIRRDGAINSSIDGVYGPGVYLSNIPPGTMTSRQLDQRFRSGQDDFRYDHYFTLDVTGLVVGRDRPDVFDVPTTEPLPIAGRVVAQGENRCE
jgi:hypothetical protein